MTLNLSTLLDVTVSLVFVFFTLSLFVSGIVEFINAFSEQRSKLLQLALIKILESEDVAKKYEEVVQDLSNQNDNTKISADIFKKFWTHPLVRVKQQRYFGFIKPISYLSADSFSTVILDLLTENLSIVSNPPTNQTLQTMENICMVVANASGTPLAPLADIVEPLLKKSNTLAEFKESLETWYDGYMEQVSGWYKRYAQAIVWVVGIAVTLLFNIDTIRITNRIFTDKTLRANLVEQAEQTAHQQTKNGLFIIDSIKAGSDNSTNAKVFRIRRIPKDLAFTTFLVKKDSSLADSVSKGAKLTSLDSLLIQDAYMQYLQDKVGSLGLPIGWEFAPKASFGGKVAQFFKMLFSWVGIGWLLTATALSFGAPFWFDLLLKVVNIRNVARKPQSSTQPN